MFSRLFEPKNCDAIISSKSLNPQPKLLPDQLNINKTYKDAIKHSTSAV